MNRKKEIRFHILFWVVYLTLWGARDMVFYPDLIGNIILNLLFTLPVAPFIYFNLYYLVPRFLLKKKWGIYFLLLLSTFIVVSWLRTHFTLFMFQDVLHAKPAVNQFSGWKGVIIIVSENLILTTITTAFFFVKEWYIKERYARELEQKNTKSELDLLKAQLQPHFLFNNLNTIYFLMESNPALAREVMLQFSDVLSHQLYNARKDKVSLKEELESLESYLKIQKLRHEDFLTLEYTLPKNTGDFVIAPMILLTFVENAFKHSQKEEGYSINISAELQGNQFHLHVENTVGQKVPSETCGVGLENVKRRLALIYPKKHELEIKESQEVYAVDLTLTLETNGQAEMHSN